MWEPYRRARTQQIFGSYCAIDVSRCSRSLATQATFSIYIGFQSDRTVYQQGIGEELRHTVATRSAVALEGGLSWDWEFFYNSVTSMDQTYPPGRWGRKRSGAQAKSCCIQPTRYVVTSSAEIGTAKTNQLNTFNPLFPKLRYFGEDGVVAPYNLIDCIPAIIVPVTEKFEMNWECRLVLARE